jgi:hypothetical protein
VNEYRVTKYNPVFRDRSGAYTKAEWTCFKHIGQTYSGVLLTAEEYERVEEGLHQNGVELPQRERPVLDEGRTA